MRLSASASECQPRSPGVFLLTKKWNNFRQKYLRCGGREFSSDSKHWQEYDIEKCPHQLLLRSPLSLPVIGPTEADDHWISWGPDPRRRNIEFQCLFHPPKNYIWWSSSLKLSPVIACEHLGCQPWHNTDSQKLDAALSRTGTWWRLKHLNYSSFYSYCTLLRGSEESRK